MKTAEFDYPLPPELIAQKPAEPRDSARLMVVDRATGRIEHRIFHQIGEYLQPGDLLILNDTRVIPARLFARKADTGGRVEILLLQQLSPRTWQALTGGRKVRMGTRLVLIDDRGVASGIQATVIGQGGSGQRLIEFDQPSSEWLWEMGNLPLPPYIRSYAGDPERYQTIYARHEGSAAAPTAGLHFTADLLLDLRLHGIRFAHVTLQVGLDTFKPIREDDIHDHTIHTEWARLGPETARQINETRLAGGRIIAVGTTAVRTLETAARKANPDNNCPADQCGWSTVTAFEGPTDLYITPGYRFRVVDVMLTNFHLPRTTLIVLVSAFAGQDLVKSAYRTAVEQRYRFYSFGDTMLIL